ncbi:MAG: ABC transporter permease [Firmicutes bacterium]|nr:ABC transporter permease [Bacillota bacterium]
MWVYIARRVLLSIPVLLGITFLIFFIAHNLPGGPLAMYLNTPTITHAQIVHLEIQLGLNRPLLVQYAAWLWQALQGNFGHSFVDGQPVVTVIGQRVPATLELMLTAIVLSYALAFVLGVASAVGQYSPFDYVVTVLSYTGMALPVFWLGIMLILVFAVDLHWFPTFGMSSTPTGYSLADNLHHLVLPVVTLAVYTLAQESRYVRSSMLEVMQQDYIRTARAKGLTERTVLFRHALRNALLPVVTVMMLDFAFLISGAVVTETVFAWPGMGRLFFDSLQQGNYPVVIGIAVLVSVMVVLMNIVADVVYALIDPRIQYR